MKRMIALLLVLIMACAWVIPTAALESFGTVVDPASGEEHPILPSVEDQIPENLDELMAVGKANEYTEAESVTETTPEQTETTAPSLEDFAAEYDMSEVSDVNLTSCRLLVSANAEAIITEDAVIAEMDGTYLMQFEDEASAKLAYMYYNDMAGYADADVPVMIADGEEAVAIEDADVAPVEMDEETNPFAEAQSVLDELQAEDVRQDNSQLLIALIDTGVSIDVNADRYSVMGGDGIDGNGHGTRMAEIIREICPEAKLLSIQATNDEGVGSASSLYAAIQLAIELKADVINLSLYGVRSEQNRTLETVIQSAVDAGINVVGAAGNSGRDTSGYIPGSMENVVVVGSVNEDGTLAAFSNFGEFVNYYVVSGSTSEAAATISALTAADGLIVDNQHVYTMYVDSSADVVDGAAPWSARTFIYAFLSDVDALAEAFGYDYLPTIDELSKYIYSTADEDSYESILLAVDVWNQELTAEIRKAVNSTLSETGSGLTYEVLAHAAYDYVMENHDGKLRIDYVTIDYESESLVPVEAYCDLGELVLITEPELHDAMTIAAYSSTDTFITTVSAKYENQYSTTYSYYASNGSKIMNMSMTQYLDYLTGQRTRDTYGDIKSHWLRTGGVDYHAYCAHPSGTFPAGYYPSNTAASNFWSHLSWNQIYGMVKAIGYSNYIIDGYNYQGGVIAATQVIIWSVAGNHMDKWGQAATRYDDGYFWNNAYNLPDGNYWSSFYRLRDLMWIHGGKPSFSYDSTAEGNADPYTPTYNSSTGLYTYTWTDTASTGTNTTYADSSQTYLERYFSFTALDDSGNPIDGITFTISGTTVTMTATPAAMATSDVITIRVNTPTRDFSDDYFGIYYSSSHGGQPVACMFGGKGKPVYAWLAINGVTQPTSFTIQKRGTSKTGPLLGGATFQLWAYDSGWSIVDTITSSTGYYTVSDLTPGKWYAIRETAAPSGYSLDDNGFRYFKGQAVSTSYPTFYNTFSDSSENVIADGYVWIDTPTTTTTPTPAPTPTPTPTPTTTNVSFNIQKRADSATGSLLSGATFSVYEYTTSWQPFATVTSSTGYYSISGLTPGRWYYIRETVAPSGYTIDDTSYRYFKAPATSGTIPTIYNTPAVSSDNAITNGHIWVDTPTTTTTPTPTPTPTPSYDYDIRVRKMNEDGTASLAGAVFEIRNASGTVLATGTTSGTYGYATWDTNNSVWFSTMNYQGQYLYIYEVEAPPGYEISLTEPIQIRPGYNPASTSGTGYSISRNSTMDYLITAYDDEEQQVQICIHKTTDDAYVGMVAGNTCYDIAGAQFVIYEALDKARSNNASDRVSFDVVNASNTVTVTNQTVLTVSSDGYTPYIRLEPDKTYYVREIQAGKGYQLPEGDSAIHSVTVTTAAQQTFTISNTPEVDPITLILEKTNYAGNPPVPLTGAQFQVQYYPGTYTESTLPTAASKTWAIRTQQSGSFYRAGFDRPGSIIAAQSDSFWVRTSSGVQEKAAGNLAESDLVNLRFPFGTYVITEILAADGYLNDPTFMIGGNSRADKLMIQIHATSDTDATPAWTLVNGANVTDLPITATNTAAVSDTIKPTVETEFVGNESDGSTTKTPAAKSSVTLSDTVSISTLDDFQGKTIRAEGHLYLLNPEGTSVSEIGNGTVTASASIAVDELVEEAVFTYTMNASELFGRTLVAYVEVYDAEDNLIASHTDIGDERQQITFRETGSASFFKHGEQLVGVTNNPNGTVTFNYEDAGLTGVTFQVIAATDIRNVRGELIYSSGQVVQDSVTTSDEEGKEGMVILEDLPFGSYILRETASDGKHTLAGDTPFTVSAETGDAVSVDHDIPNTRKTVTVDLEKVGSVNQSQPVPGAKYGLYANENIMNYKGEKVLDKDTPVAYAITDDLGKAVFVTAGSTNVDLPVGYTWVVRELYVPAGYDLDDTEYLVSFTETDSDTAHIDRHVDGSDGDGKVTDAQQPGKIVLTKLNATGNRLPGTKYVLEYALSENGPWNPVFYNDGSTGYGYVAGGCDSEGLGSDGSLITDFSGVAEFTGLLADGTVFYRVTEISTPDGYQLLTENIMVGTLPKAADETLEPAIYDIDGDGMADVFDERIVSLFGNSGGEPSLTQLRQYNSDVRKHDVANGDMPFNRRYILTYTVTNSAVLELPRTGAHGFAWLPFACAGLAAAGAVTIAWAVGSRKKKKAYIA